MILTVLITTFVTLFLSIEIGVPLLLSACILCSTRIWSAAKYTLASLLILIISVVITTTCIYVMYWFLFYLYRLPSERVCFHCAAVFNAFSRHIAYSYASCGVSVSAEKFSAIFSLCKCAVNMSLTQLSSRSPQSAHDASSSRSMWNCSRLSFFFGFVQMKLYL